jgi:hypothetical protein
MNRDTMGEGGGKMLGTLVVIARRLTGQAVYVERNIEVLSCSPRCREEQ